MVPPRDRLPFLIEEFGRGIQPVDWRPASHIDPLLVEAHCTFAETAGVRTADIRWSSGTVTPGSDAFDGSLADSMIVFRERQQAGWYELSNGAVHHTVPGSLILHPAEQSFIRGGVPASFDFNFQLAAIPRSVFFDLGLSRDIPQILHLPPNEPLHALLSAYFADWSRLVAELDSEAARTSTNALITLLSIAGGVLDPRAEEAKGGVATARVRAANHFIASNLSRPELSPEIIARALSISVRQLHLDFEATGLSVARTILAARIRLAKRMLVERPNLTIIEVAFACGFDAVSTFYRVFRAQAGVTASEYRQQAKSRTAERS